MGLESAQKYTSKVEQQVQLFFSLEVTLKMYRAPQGKSSSKHHFSGVNSLLSFGGVYPSGKEKHG